MIVRLYNLDDTLQYGKHSGKTIREIIDSDPGEITRLLVEDMNFDLAPEAYIAVFDKNIDAMEAGAIEASRKGISALGIASANRIELNKQMALQVALDRDRQPDQQETKS